MAEDLNRSIKIYIDNSDAMSKSKDLKGEISKLENSLKSLSEQGKKDTLQYKKQKKSLDQNTKAYAIHQNKVRETERVLKNLSGATYKELQSVQRVLRREVQEAARGTEDYTRKLKLYKNVQSEITVAQKAMNGQYGKQASVFSKMTDGFNKYFGIATAFIASITGASLAFRKLSQDAAAMEDTYADVMKTTGLTREEVGELNDELKKMDTRTAREQLNLLARDAGKLGMDTKKDILDFVEAGNIINVALGEDLGEDAIKQIGKMSNVFQTATKEISDLDLKSRMLSIGSAVNEVAQSSSASEPYLVAFAGRLGGVAAQAGIGIDKILGFASALDQDMQAVEMSATALQKLIITMMSKPAEFASLAKMEVSAFTNLLKTDANEAIKTVLRSLNEKGGFQDLIPVFQEMGLDGARAVGVLSSMANGIDRIDEAQSIANKSMIEATSVMDEYNIKNENAAASLEKRKKAFNDAAEDLGRRLNPALLKSTNLLTYVIKALPAILDFFAKWGPILVKITALMIAYNLTIKAQVMWKRLAIVDSIKLALMYARESAATAILSVKYMLASRSAKQLMMSTRALFVTLGLNPLAIIVTLVAAVTYGLWKMSNETEKLLTKQNALIDVNEKAAKSIATESTELKLMLSIAQNERISKHERLKAIQKLNRISPEYLGFLNLENINTQKATSSIKLYTAELLKNAKQKAIVSKVSEAYAIQLEEEAKIIDIKKKKEAWHTINDEQTQVKAWNREIKQSQDIVDAKQKEIDIYSSLNEKMVDSKHEAEINAAVKIQALNREQKILEELQQKQADLHKPKPIDEVVIPYRSEQKNLFETDFYDTNFAYQQEVKNIASRIEMQKKLVEQKQKELEVVEQIVKVESEDDAPLSGDTPDKSVDIYKEKLAIVDAYLAKEKNILLEARYEGAISQEKYLRDLEALEMEGLQRKMSIYQLDSDQQIQVQSLIYEKKIQIMQKIRDEEVAHQKRLSDIQKQAEKARAEENWSNLKLIAKQNEVDAKASYEKQNKQRAEMISMGIDFSNDMGQMIGGFISGNEDIVASSLKSIINMGLDMLKVQVQMAVAGATAMSLAQPDSVLTFGAAGFARAALMVGLIEAAFSAVKGVVSSAIGNMGSDKASATISGDALTGQRVVTQRASGKYDVIGADDGRTYSGVPYIGDARTGVVSTPTLMGEYGGELVVNAPDFRALQRHVNYPVVLQAIQQSRQPHSVPQRADGNYSNLPQNNLPQNDNYLVKEMIELLNYMKSNPMKAYVVLSELQAKQILQETSQKIGSK